ncbi:MAG: phosphoserine phosphatase SerB [Epsilonproteobacteria bacterium]|nr:phosphoserine phosphatase SerB [Campylobacterota bacterium]NPA56939.1 phosphoserine phosphatase SerB [Campylobacterota bacterium]
MKLCVFDFDSTLMDGETIDFLAAPLGLKEKVGEITEMAMRGELDFFESLIMRVKLLEGLEVSQVDEICHNLPYMPGAKETIGELQERGYRVVVFSGGFRNATGYARKVLGFDSDFSNILHAKDGRLTGLVGGEMMFNWSKGDMLERLQRLLGIPPERTVAVGDGANDRSMFAYASKRVAFCAKEVLKKEANIIIDRKDLRELLNYLE